MHNDGAEQPTNDMKGESSRESAVNRQSSILTAKKFGHQCG